MDLDKALENLMEALKEYRFFKPHRLSKEHQLKISEILQGTHLTFRYLLFTALLAKYTDPDIHMRSLQAGAHLEGAYDARSLCHKVIVPFEKDMLEGRLGNSNEPFLNKPARFPMIDPTNPVRAGRDKRCLNDLSNLLEELNYMNREYHRESLFFAMSIIFERESKASLSIKLPDIKLSFSEFYDIIDRFLSLSHEGQSSVAVIGAIMKKIYDKNMKILIHPTNQSGKSSREIGDIDVIQKNKLLYAIEVKDKNYTETDIWHALEKVMTSGHTKLVFAIGQNANSSLNFKDLISQAEDRGFDLTFLEIKSFVQNILSLLDENERLDFFKSIYQILIEMRAKDNVINTYKSLIGLWFI